jgi:GntR family transcriptional regulator
MLPFSIVTRPGRPLHDQIVFAVTKAVITGQMQPGDSFPSVRTLSQELGVNPNTSAKAIATLIERGLLESHPGIGTTVARWRRRSASDGRAAVNEQLDRLVVEAKQLGLDLDNLVSALRKAWK